jgi:hypothetical protein
MSKHYYFQHLKQYDKGERKVLLWKKCPVKSCPFHYPLFTNMKYIKSCEHYTEYRLGFRNKHGNLLRLQNLKKTNAERKNNVHYASTEERPKHILTLCKPLKGECVKYAEGFSMKDIEAGCWGEKYFKEDGSCYVKPR